MKRTVKFTDADRIKVVIEIDTTNNYWSFSGDYGDSFGQMLDYIKPRNSVQQDIMNLWHRHHLQKLDADKRGYDAVEEIINDACDAIDEEEEGYMGAEITEDDAPLFDEAYSPERKLAFALLVGACRNEYDELPACDECEVHFGGRDYYFGTDAEMDEAWNDNLENYVDELILPEIPKQYRAYFDGEKFIQDCKYDGRAHVLNSYDGSEEEVNVNDTWYYLYRR